MFAVRAYQTSLVAALTVTTFVYVTACSSDEPTGPAVTDVLLAKGGRPDPAVESTDPPGAPQDTTLDVLVFGSGFDDGSVAELTLDGVPTAKVRTNSTQYVSSKQLKANITIDSDAVIDLYDVEVMTTRGKKGIGVDLFSVIEKGGQPDWVDDTVYPITAEFDAAGTVQSDTVQSDSDYPYEDAHFRANGTLWVDARGQGGQPSPESDRKICFVFPPEPPDLPPDGCFNGFVSTVDRFDPDNANIYGMKDGGPPLLNPTGTIYWSAPAEDGTRYGWFLQFGYDCDNTTAEDGTNNTQDKRLTATWWSESEEEWTIEGDAATLCRWPERGKPEMQTLGDITMPFKLTLRLVPGS